MLTHTEGNIKLKISNLQERHKLSPALLTSFSEACAVVLDQLTKDTPIQFKMVMNENESILKLDWEKPNSLTKKSYANTKDATEYGAYALAFASLDALEDYQVVHRAFQGSGSDFLLMKRGETNDENVIRLEVSGIFDNGNLNLRVREKVEQLEKGKLKKPGIAHVTAFNQELIQARRVP